MYTQQSRHCSHGDVNNYGGDDVLAFSPACSLLMPQSLTSSFCVCSAFIPFSHSVPLPSPPVLHPSDLDYTFFQLPELNNTLQHISMLPYQKTEIQLMPLLSVCPPFSLPLSHTLGSAFRVNFHFI